MTNFSKEILDQEFNGFFGLGNGENEGNEERETIATIYYLPSSKEPITEIKGYDKEVVLALAQNFVDKMQEMDEKIRRDLGIKNGDKSKDEDVEKIIRMKIGIGFSLGC